MDLTPGPGEDRLDTDALPPTQYLIMEVLAARYRTGEQMWTFPDRLRPQMKVLEQVGLVGWKSGIVEDTVLVWLTEAGRSAALFDGYETPIEKIRAEGYRAGREDAARAIEEWSSRVDT